MADPTTDPETVLNNMDPQKIEEYTEKMHAASAATKVFNVDGADSADMLSNLHGRLAQAGIDLEDMGNLSGVAATKFGLLGNFAVGAAEHFKRFNESVDPGRLGSFSDQMTSLITTVGGEGKAMGVATEAGGKLFSMLGKMGVAGKELSEIAKFGSTQLAAYAKNFLIGADNTLRFESALMDAAQQAGNTNEIYKATGAHLEKLNAVYSQFAGIMGDTMMATHKSTEEISKYAISIASMPGGLTEMSKSMEIAGQKTSLLTAMIRFADGAGADHNQLMRDTAKATAQFGIAASDAFRYTARLADISTDLGAKQADVGDVLAKTSEAFRLYNMHGVDSIKMSQGLADTVKNYAQSLRDAGVPAAEAIELTGKYTHQLANMGEAEKSFLSQQTGGPGGLAGKFAMNKLMREHPEQVLEKQKELMKKLSGGGELVSEKEAEDNPALQQKMELQQKIMMGGSLGVKAADENEANAMIQAMKEGKQITGTNASKSLADTIQKGAEKEQVSATAVQQMDITAEMVRLQASGMNLSTLQNATTARSGAAAQGGTDGTGRGTNPENVDRLRAAQLAGMHPAAGSPTEKMGSLMARSVNDIPKALNDAGKSISEQLSQGTNTVGQLPTPGATTNQPSSPAQPSLGLGSLGMDGFKPNIKPAGADYTPAGKQVGQALPSGTTAGATTHSAATARTTSGVTGAGPASAQPIPVMLASGSAITVNFTGKCPHCGSNIHTSEQAAIQSPASVARS